MNIDEIQPKKFIEEKNIDEIVTKIKPVGIKPFIPDEYFDEVATESNPIESKPVEVTRWKKIKNFFKRNKDHIIYFSLAPISIPLCVVGGILLIFIGPLILLWLNCTEFVYSRFTGKHNYTPPW